jgi:hypothetical protein
MCLNPSWIINNRESEGIRTLNDQSGDQADDRSVTYSRLKLERTGNMKGNTPPEMSLLYAYSTHRSTKDSLVDNYS